MNAKDVLTQARGFIEKPEHWTQFAYARRAGNGQVTGYRSEKAFSFCTMGALYRAADNALAAGSLAFEGSPAQLLRQAFLDLYGASSVSDFQDSSDCTHDKVLAAYDLAISRAS